MWITCLEKSLLFEKLLLKISSLIIILIQVKIPTASNYPLKNAKKSKKQNFCIISSKSVERRQQTLDIRNEQHIIQQSALKYWLLFLTVCIPWACGVHCQYLKHRCITVISSTFSYHMLQRTSVFEMQILHRCQVMVLTPDQKQFLPTT